MVGEAESLLAGFSERGLEQTMKRTVAFVGAACTIVAALGTWTGMRTVETEDGERSMRIVLSGPLEGRITPEKIDTIALYQLNLNLWATLIDDDRGSVIAKSFEIDSSGKRYSFLLNSEARFSNGRKIDVDDVIYSVKRLMASQEDGHFNAKSVIESIEKESETRVVFKLKNPTPSFLFLLSMPEFGVVSRKDVNEDGRLNGLAVTSGAYSIARVEGQEVELQKNPYFQNHASGSPDRVYISFRRGLDEFYSELETGRYSFLEFYDGGAEDLIEFLEKKKLKFEVKKTRPSASVFLTPNTKLLSEDVSKAFAKLFKERFRNFFSESETEKYSAQYLPQKTFGSFNPDEVPEIESVSAELPKNVTIRTSHPDSPLKKAVTDVLKNEGIEAIFVSWKEAKEYHLTLVGQGMNANHPEIEFFLSMVGAYAFIDVPEETKKNIRKMAFEVDENARNILAKQISGWLLKTGSVIPLTVRSYVHFYDSTKLDIGTASSYDGDVPIYKFRMI